MEKQVLTVGRLIEDLGQFDKDAIVQMGVRHLEMTIPIGGLMKGEFDGKQVVVLVTDPYKVKEAFDYAKQEDLKSIRDQGMIILDSVN